LEFVTWNIRGGNRKYEITPGRRSIRINIAVSTKTKKLKGNMKCVTIQRVEERGKEMKCSDNC
jgi:hypothetical protein